METPRYEQLTIGILIKREAGVFGPRGLALFYDATQKSEPVRNQMSSEKDTKETIMPRTCSPMIAGRSRNAR